VKKMIGKRTITIISSADGTVHTRHVLYTISIKKCLVCV